MMVKTMQISTDEIADAMLGCEEMLFDVLAALARSGRLPHEMLDRGFSGSADHEVGAAWAGDLAIGAMAMRDI